MIPCTNNHGRALWDGWRALAGRSREPRAKLLQSSQAARRLGEPEVSPSRFFRSGLVGWRYLRCEFHYPVFERQC